MLVSWVTAASETLKLTPFYNALVGGRGTGKSTIVQAIRLAFRRDGDMKRFREGAELRRQFERFATVFKSRDEDGALRENTEIFVTLMREGVAHRLRWRRDTKGNVVEEQDQNGLWHTSASESINSDRFPNPLVVTGPDRGHGC